MGTLRLHHLFSKITFKQMFTERRQVIRNIKNNRYLPTLITALIIQTKTYYIVTSDYSLP